jgi:hypothetical protein
MRKPLRTKGHLMAKKKPPEACTAEVAPTPPAAEQAREPYVGNSEPPREQLSNKMEGVRRALGELGKDATTNEIQGFLQDRFGIEMSTKMVSSYKSALLRKDRASQPGGRKPREAAPQPAPARGEVSLKDIRTLKEIADRLGARQFRELVDSSSLEPGWPERRPGESGGGRPLPLPGTVGFKPRCASTIKCGPKLCALACAVASPEVAYVLPTGMTTQDSSPEGEGRRP